MPGDVKKGSRARYANQVIESRLIKESFIKMVVVDWGIFKVQVEVFQK